MTVTASTTDPRVLSAARRWPMTGEARDRLVDEITQLRRDLALLDGGPVEDGLIRLPAARAERRLDTLAWVLDGAEVVDRESGADSGPTRAVIGRRVTMRDGGGQTDCYALVFPGDGDPRLGWISADAPLGAAILGAAAGDTVTVEAPLGRWATTIVAVE